MGGDFEGGLDAKRGGVGREVVDGPRESSVGRRVYCGVGRKVGGGPRAGDCVLRTGGGGEPRTGSCAARTGRGGVGKQAGGVLQATHVSGSLATGGAELATGGAELSRRGGYLPEGVTRAAVQGGGAGGGRRQVGATLGAVESCREVADARRRYP